MKKVDVIRKADGKKEGVTRKADGNKAWDNIEAVVNERAVFHEKQVAKKKSVDNEKAGSKKKAVVNEKAGFNIGTSGWHYKHWRGTFYPANLKANEQFEYYCKVFSTVEINNSFYRLPPASVFAEWRSSAPANFLFAVKASRFITHMKKLNVEPESISIFFHHAARLQEKLGPILFQLPPRWKVNAGRLDRFLQNLPQGFRYTIEFRNDSWYNEEVYAILEKYNVSFCIYELEGHQSPIITTADFVYIRLHGPGAKYQGSYTDTVLSGWAKRIRGWNKKGKEVFIYFDNDQEGYAAFNALTISGMLAGKKKKPVVSGSAGT